jgi:hypothetical protein
VKRFMIKYQFTNGTEEDWHNDVKRFIADIDSDPEIKGKISYRCMKINENKDYYHLVAAEDDAVGVLQSRDYFKRYTEKANIVGGDAVDVLPLTVIAETARPA